MAEYGRVLNLMESRRGRLEGLEERASRGSMADGFNGHPPLGVNATEATTTGG